MYGKSCSLKSQKNRNDASVNERKKPSKCYLFDYLQPISQQWYEYACTICSLRKKTSDQIKKFLMGRNQCSENEQKINKNDIL